MKLTKQILAFGEGIYLGTLYKVEIARLWQVTAYRYEARDLHTEWYELSYKRSHDRTFSRSSYPKEFLDARLPHWFANLQLHHTPHAPTFQIVTVMERLIEQPMIAFRISQDAYRPFQCEFGKRPYDLHEWDSVVMPTIKTLHHTYTAQDPNFGNALYELLGQTVMYADEYVDAGIIFDFANGSSLEFNLKQPKYDFIKYKGPNEVEYDWYVALDEYEEYE